MLDNSTILIMSEMGNHYGDGTNQHQLDPLPAIVAGGNRVLPMGQTIDARGRAVNDLLRSCLKSVGLDQPVGSYGSGPLI